MTYSKSSKREKGLTQNPARESERWRREERERERESWKELYIYIYTILESERESVCVGYIRERARKGSNGS